ncbi:hypothetical protein B0A58_05965 [Flavobacterium branchiophilum NBRC 15030 = ATCC 35035]|nr:hypothetical protein B0A58_05965 [Flavobacterium branchiophilum NBRC 15030 = ATCC 35035]
MNFKMKKKHLFVVLFFLGSMLTWGQDVYGGIEIGGKGIKVSVIKIEDLQIGQFEIIKTWTRNTNIIKNIDAEGNFTQKDIDETSYIVFDLIEAMKKDFSIAAKNIFVIASSSVGVAKNKQDLINKINTLTTRNIDFISSDLESKMIIKGAIPQKEYTNSLILDIGSGSVKGGIVNVEKNNTFSFMPLGMKFGTTTLTERIRKISGNSTFGIVDETNKFKDTLNQAIKTMYNKNPTSKSKSNVYLLGGSVWAFITLSKPYSNEDYEMFTYSDLTQYHKEIMDNYDKYVKRSFVSTEYERVLKTFPRETIIAGSTIINQLVSNLENPESKNYYFVRQGQIAWLLSYIVDSARKSK